MPEKFETVSSPCVLVERVPISSLPAYVGQASISYDVLRANKPS